MRQGGREDAWFGSPIGYGVMVMSGEDHVWQRTRVEGERKEDWVFGGWARYGGEVGMVILFANLVVGVMWFGQWAVEKERKEGERRKKEREIEEERGDDERRGRDTGWLKITAWV